MKITTKTTFFWCSVIAISLAGALAYRGRVVVPRQLAIEQRGDQRDIARFEKDLQTYRRLLTDRIERLHRTAELLQNLDSQVDWSIVLREFARVATTKDIDFFIIASESQTPEVFYGQEIQEQLFPPPNNKAINEVYNVIKAKMPDSNEGISGFINSTNDGPLIYAATKSKWVTASEPKTLIAVLRLNSENIRYFSRRLNLNVSALPSRAALEEAMFKDHTELEQRSKNDTLYTIFHDDNGNELLYLRFNTDHRLFEVAAFTKQTMGFLIFFLLSLALMQYLSYRQVLGPVNRTARKMRQIRQHSNYDDILHYQYNDEVGKLIDECNELLRHVKDHTLQLETLSYTDALTGIGNRRLFQERLSYLWQLAERKELPIILIMFDIDYFKQYNDTYGHDAGDIALQKFAGVLQEVFARDTDIVCRTGGEEFSVLLLAQKATTVEALTNKVIAGVLKLNIEHLGNPDQKVLSCSAGLCRMIPEGGRDTSQLIRSADQALYQAKQQGRNRLQIFATATEPTR